MQVLRFIAVFAAVSVLATIAALTASFMVWSIMPVQPGTAAALFTLFILAPGVGIVTGLSVAVRSVRRAGAGAPSGDRPRGNGAAIVLALLAGLVGYLAGYGGTLVAIDMTYTDRWANPASAPAWIPHAPGLAGAVLACIFAALVWASRR